ncbi:MAG TPA: hypothetical protein DIS79_00600 [Bacteroidetes bacterium]|nr:hypothetical protein [Bacteroidota bacterium]
MAYFRRMYEILMFTSGPVETNSFLLLGTSVKTAVLIDAPPGCAEVVNTALVQHGSSLSDIYLTHTHWDHIGDCYSLQERWKSNVWVHEADTYRLTNPMEHTIWPLPFVIPAVDTYTTYDIREYHGSTSLQSPFGPLTVLHTPGHTEGGVCIIDETHQRAYVGDTLFSGSIGRTDLPGGDYDELIESIRIKLFTLTDDVVCYPGHGPVTTIGRERRSNPFLTVSV